MLCMTLTLSQIKTLSDTSAADSFLKTCQQISNFSFCHHVFNPIQFINWSFRRSKGFSVLLPRRFQSRLLQICCMRERVNTNIPHADAFRSLSKCIGAKGVFESWSAIFIYMLKCYPIYNKSAIDDMENISEIKGKISI